MDKVITLWEFNKLPTEIIFKGFDLKAVCNNLYCFIDNDFILNNEEAYVSLKPFVDHVIEFKNGMYHAISSEASQC